MKKLLICLGIALSVILLSSFSAKRSDYATVSQVGTFYGDAYRVDKLNVDGRTFYVFTTDKGGIFVKE